MKTYKLIILLSFFLSIQIFSQTFSIGIGSGINFITGENYYTNSLGRIGLYENVNGTNTNLTGMGLNTEFQLQAIGKFSFNNSPICLIAAFNYLPLRGTEQMLGYDEYLQYEFLQDVTAKMDIWSFQLGVNYYFNLSFLKPFFSASLSANYFDDMWIEFDRGDYIAEFRSYENGMRYGYSVGLGAAYEISKYFDAELSGNFNSFNQLGRREGEELLNSINVLLLIYYKIN